MVVEVGAAVAIVVVVVVVVVVVEVVEVVVGVVVAVVVEVVVEVVVAVVKVVVDDGNAFKTEQPPAGIGDKYKGPALNFWSYDIACQTDNCITLKLGLFGGFERGSVAHQITAPPPVELRRQ